MGILNRLLGRNKPTLAPDGMSREMAQNIIADYGDVMSKYPGDYWDSSSLPHPKAKIKEALLFAILATNDASAREPMKAGYVLLSNWQDGIGPGPHSLQVVQIPGEDVMVTAKRITEGMPANLIVAEKAAAEGRALLAELVALGL